ncbi:MAG: hypothetical protein COC19_00170 [SAR86 cluster bacterium]|uniref:DUF481 domain-containing protein n=1 Tax=SAR86 cluster bacterium TaxID=2030880 RepID=A0A2A4MVN9_9GAMM|nr:MAG: hypothetical protein COC19_00170 [SAR86 cluster bacterium]
MDIDFSALIAATIRQIWSSAASAFKKPHGRTVLSVARVLPWLCVTSAVFAQTPTGLIDEAAIAKPSPWLWLDDRQQRVSKRVATLGSALDDWLAGEVVGEHSNESFLRLRLNQSLDSIDGYDSKFKIGGQLDLPRASERWKLIFNTDTEDLNSLEQNKLDSVNSGVALAGFRFEQKLKDKWRFSHDLGVRARMPIDPFYRFKASYNTDLNKDWSLGFRQRVWHFRSEGWGYLTQVSVDRSLDDNSVLRINTDVKYRDDVNEIEFGQSVAIHRTLGELETLTYELGLFGLNSPNTRINDYYLQTAYRRAIRSDWLILELIPQLIVSRDESWKPQMRMTLNLEMFFFDF